MVTAVLTHSTKYISTLIHQTETNVFSKYSSWSTFIPTMHYSNCRGIVQLYILFIWYSICTEMIRVGSLCSSLQVGVQTSQKQFFPTNSKLRLWETFSEDISSVASDTKLTVIGLLDQLNITRDSSDYLWYTTK